MESPEDKAKFQKILEEKVLDKAHVELGEDFISLTVICYLKETREELMINSHKQAQNLSNVLIVMTC